VRAIERIVSFEEPLGTYLNVKDLELEGAVVGSEICPQGSSFGDLRLSSSSLMHCETEVVEPQLEPIEG